MSKWLNLLGPQCPSLCPYTSLTDTKTVTQQGNNNVTVAWTSVPAPYHLHPPCKFWSVQPSPLSALNLSGYSIWKLWLKCTPHPGFCSVAGWDSRGWRAVCSYGLLAPMQTPLGRDTNSWYKSSEVSNRWLEWSLRKGNYCSRGFLTRHLVPVPAPKALWHTHWDWDKSPESWFCTVPWGERDVFALTSTVRNCTHCHPITVARSWKQDAL